MESGEAGEVAVVGDPVAPRLDCKSGEIGIWHEVSRGSHRRAESPEEAEMVCPGSNHDAVRMAAYRLDIVESVRDRRRLGVDPGMRHDTNDPAQDEFRNPEWGGRRDGRLQPLPVLGMAGGVDAGGEDEDIDVREDQC